jgi:hypothetical protein
MLNIGPSGFHKAPITKCIFILVLMTSFLSVLCQVAQFLVLQPALIFKQGQIWRLLLHHFPFTSSGELLIGGVLLYSTRLFERRYGSSKYMSMITLITLYSTCFQMIILLILGRYIPLTITRHQRRPIHYFYLFTSAPGPYNLIYASFIYFMTEVPITYRFRIGKSSSRYSILISDKTLFYVLSFQLAISRGRASLVSSLSTILSTLLYRANLGHVQKWRYPLYLQHLFRRLYYKEVELNPSSDSAGSLSFLTSRNNPSRQTSISQEQLDSFISTSQSEEYIERLTSMGFSYEASRNALNRSRNDLQRALHFLIENS